MFTTLLYCFLLHWLSFIAFVLLVLWNMLILDVLEYGKKIDSVKYCIVWIINKYHYLAEESLRFAFSYLKNNTLSGLYIL